MEGSTADESGSERKKSQRMEAKIRPEFAEAIASGSWFRLRNYRDGVRRRAWKIRDDIKGILAILRNGLEVLLAQPTLVEPRLGRV